MNNKQSLPPGFLAGLEPLSRRRFLTSGVRIAAAAGTLAMLPGQVLGGAKSGLPDGIKHISELDYRVFNRLRLVMLPTEKFDLPSSEEIPVMQNLDVWVGKLNKRTRLLLTLGVQTIEYGSLYRFSRFSQMSDKTAAKHVHNWQTGNVLQRGVMSSLKMLVTLAYWQDTRTWPALQYDGPVTEKWGIRRLGNAPLPR
ncbi:MAG: transcriptional initiation protein Tat [Pseudomonadota bacterium]